MSGDVPGNPALPAGSMFSLGWLMAQLFGPVQHRQGSETQAHLPTVAELDPDDYMAMTFLDLEKLLEPFPDLSDADIKTAWHTAGHGDFPGAVRALHLKILLHLADDHQQLGAYQLGRALSDTCWLPDQTAGAEFFLREFGRYRLATLQSWLAQASDTLPAQSAAIVSRSLQNWQDWADVNAAQIRNGWATANRSVVASLRAQGAAWRGLLGGVTDLSGQTSVDAWIHAGQSILRTTRVLLLTILRRAWPALLVVAAATGGLLYLATANSSGAAKVWTSLVTVAAAFGLTGASLRSTALKTAGVIELDVRNAADLDARAWSITWLPTVPQSRLQRYRLASRGVDAPQVKNGLTPSGPPEPAPVSPVLSAPAPPQLAAR